ncbi:MAG: hypothetical protein AB1679_08895 [Actinomycetota bacterium]
MRRHTLLAAMATITIVTAACSSGGSPRTSAPADSEQSNTDKRDERLTPLSAFFTEGHGGEPTQAERDAAAEDFRRQEQIIAECMQEQGFQYIPRDYHQAVDSKVKNVEAFDLPPDQYAERWGYGISTIDASQFKPEAPEDPNSAIVEALSPEARSAYDKALYGIDLSRENAIVSAGEGGTALARPKGSSLDSPVPDGCQTRALREVYGEFAAGGKPPSSEFDALNEEMGALWDRVANDSRVVAAKAGWSDCMADAGHPEATDPDNAAQLVIERFSELYGVDPSQFKEVRAGMKSAPQQPDPAALAEVQRYERSLAMADRRCKAEYDEAVFTVQTEVENRFIEENRAELERYRDSVGLQGGGRAARLRIGAMARGGKG